MSKAMAVTFTPMKSDDIGVPTVQVMRGDAVVATLHRWEPSLGGRTCWHVYYKNTLPSEPKGRKRWPAGTSLADVKSDVRAAITTVVAEA